MSPVERESMEVDVLYIGAGPASLASSLHLMNQVKAFNQRAESEGKAPIEPPSVLILEKGAAVGDHMLSGAVMNPRGIRELVPDFVEEGFPTEYVCDYAGFWIFHPKGKISAPGPFVPPNFRKKGYHVVSLNKVAKWMAERCEEAGVEIYPGFAGDKILTEGNRVIGVRTGDMGVDKDGKPKGTFQPGMDIFAKVTVLGEGVRGSLSKQLIADFDLDGMNPQTFETGVKELWRIDPKKHRPGRVVHGLGIPQIFDGFHGMWLYDMQDSLVSFGFVTMLDSENPNCDPHLAAQKFKTTPYMKWLLEGAELMKYGAKCIPTGGLYSMPKLYTNGALLIGDAASFCNAEKLSGIHLAIKSGMMAADTIVEALALNDFSVTTLGGFTERFRDSWAFDEHWPVPPLPPIDGSRCSVLPTERTLPAADEGAWPHRQHEVRCGPHAHEAVDRTPRNRSAKKRRSNSTVCSPSARSTSSSSAEPNTRRTSPPISWWQTPICAARPALKNSGIRARTSAPPRSTRWFRTPSGSAARNSSSTTRTASTARPAMSPIPTR